MNIGEGNLYSAGSALGDGNVLIEFEPVTSAIVRDGGIKGLPAIIQMKQKTELDHLLCKLQ